MPTSSAVRHTPNRVGGLAFRVISNALIRLLDPQGPALEIAKTPSDPSRVSRARREPPCGSAWSSYWAAKAIENAHEGLPLCCEIEGTLPFLLPDQLAAALERAAQASDGAGVDAAGSCEVDRWVRELPSELQSRVERTIIERSARGLPATFLRLEAEELAKAASIASDPVHAPATSPTASRTATITSRAFDCIRQLFGSMRALREQPAAPRNEELDQGETGQHIVLNAEWSRYWSHQVIEQAHSGRALGELVFVPPSILPAQFAEVLELFAGASDGTGVDAKGSSTVDEWVCALPPDLRANLERVILDRGLRGLPATFVRLETEELSKTAAVALATASPTVPARRSVRRV